MLIEYCCSQDSMLGRSSPQSVGCKSLRLTEAEDMTDENNVDKVITEITAFGKPTVTLWASIPCTGGSSWQYINEMIYLKTGNKRALRRLRGLRTTFRKLWSNFVAIAQEVINIGGNVCIEWPLRCIYWKDPQVVAFCQSLELTAATVHGCAYGLRDSKGTHLKKPWKIMTSSRDIAKGIHRECPGGHEHGHCRGRECKRTELYTREMANAIHVAIRASHA